MFKHYHLLLLLGLARRILCDSSAGAGAPVFEPGFEPGKGIIVSWSVLGDGNSNSWGEKAKAFLFPELLAKVLGNQLVVALNLIWGEGAIHQIVVCNDLLLLVAEKTEHRKT